MVQLAGFYRWIDRELFVWRVRGSRLRARLQFSASQDGEAMSKKASQLEARRHALDLGKDL
jgi:hypothetical protein